MTKTLTHRQRSALARLADMHNAHLGMSSFATIHLGEHTTALLRRLVPHGFVTMTKGGSGSRQFFAITDAGRALLAPPAPVSISVGIEDHSVAARYRRLHRIIERILWSGPGKPAMDHPQTQEAMSELSDVMLMDALIEASAPAKDERSPDELLARMNRAADLAMHAYVSSAKPETLAHLRKMIDAKMPAPAGHVVASEPVQDQWFTDRNLPIMALSDDVESDRVLKLHFRRPVSDDDRKALVEALNVYQKSLSEPDAVGLSIADLQRAHVERQEEWCPDQKPDLSFRGNELGGE